MKHLFIFFLLSFSFISCNSQIKDFDYDMFEDYKISYESILLQDYEEYYVYIYSSYCGHCKEIKNDILNLIYEKKANIFLYEVDEYIEFCTEKSEIKEKNSICIVGTPTIFYVQSNQISKIYQGTKKILLLIDSFT